MNSVNMYHSMLIHAHVCAYFDPVLSLVEHLYSPDVVENWVSRVSVYVVGDDGR